MNSSSSNSSDDLTDTAWHLAYPLAPAIVIGLVIFTTSVVTFVGNILVLMAFSAEKKLQITRNYFLLSLAVADSFVGLVSVNIWAVIYLSDGRWPFGQLGCVMWIYLDYVMCTTSIYHVFVISVDRYWSVARPAQYRIQMNGHVAKLMIGVTWGVSVVWWAGLILAHPLVVGWQVPEGSCWANYWGNQSLTVMSTSVTYWIPLVITTVLYINIYRVASRLRKRRMVEGKRLKEQLMKNSKNPKPAAPQSPVNVSSSVKTQSTSLSTNRVSQSESTSTLADLANNKLLKSASRFNIRLVHLSVEDFHELEDEDLDEHQSRPALVVERQPGRGLASSRFKMAAGRIAANRVHEKQSKPLLRSDDDQLENGYNGVGSHSQQQPQQPKKKPDLATLVLDNLTSMKQKSAVVEDKRRAMKTLTLLLCAFVLCWTPWNIAEIINSVYGTGTVNYHVYQITWLLTYLNSSLNPICYAMANTLFKDTFIAILTCRRFRQPDLPGVSFSR